MLKRLLLLTLGIASLFAEEIDENSFSYWDVHPLHAGGNFIALGKADVTETPEGGDLVFRKGNVFTSLLVPLNRHSFFIPRVEWNDFYLNWNNNPKFSQSNYSYIQFALTFFSNGLKDWRWVSRVEYNVDVQHFDEPRTYGLFSALLWGTYEIHRKWHTHIGAFGYTGFAGSQVYPIIGLDFSPNRHWTFLFVFPIDYSVQYKFNPNWRLSLEVRPLKERFRTGDNEPQPRSVFCYTSQGIELNLHYERFLRLETEIFFGYNFGGSYYIKNAVGQNALYTSVGGSPYAGASLDFGF